jgi:hypothetical protein
LVSEHWKDVDRQHVGIVGGGVIVMGSAWVSRVRRDLKRWQLTFHDFFEFRLW